MNSLKLAIPILISMIWTGAACAITLLKETEVPRVGPNSMLVQKFQENPHVFGKTTGLKKGKYEFFYAGQELSFYGIKDQKIHYAKYVKNIYEAEEIIMMRGGSFYPAYAIYQVFNKLGQSLGHIALGARKIKDSKALLKSQVQFDAN